MFLLDHPLAFFFVLVILLIGFVEIGFRLALRTAVNADHERHEQIVSARDGIGILLSLLLGFTLAMALPRFTERKQLVVDEANAIGTTALRAQLLPEPSRSQVSALLRQYVDARLDYSRDGVSPEGIRASLQRSGELQKALWNAAAQITRDNPSLTTSLFLQALNSTIDLRERRLAARENRIPPPVWVMLVVMAALTCLTVGYSMPRRFWYVMTLSPVMICVVLTLVADLDSPRGGYIRVGQPSMERLQRSMYDDASHQP